MLMKLSSEMLKVMKSPEWSIGLISLCLVALMSGLKHS
jgi:hypothetical protein